MANEKDQEYEAAEQAAEEYSANAFILKLKPAFEYNGQKYDKLVFDFEKLTGEDYVKIEHEINALGSSVIAAEFNGDFLVRACSRACLEKIGFDGLQKLSFKNYHRLRSAARSFLMSMV